MEESCRCANSYYHNRPQLKLEAETTHQATFKAHQLPARPQLEAPKVVQKHYDPSLLCSSYKANFTKPGPTVADSQTDSLAQHLNNKPRNVPFYSGTSYKESYPRHEVKVSKQPSYQYQPPPTKFEGQSSYKATFVAAKTSSHPDETGPSLKDYMGLKKRVPFEGQSAYKETFKNPGVRPERPPEFKYAPKQTKFEGESSYKSSFGAIPRSAYGPAAEECPVHPGKLVIK